MLEATGDSSPKLRIRGFLRAGDLVESMGIHEWNPWVSSYRRMAPKKNGDAGGEDQRNDEDNQDQSPHQNCLPLIVLFSCALALDPHTHHHSEQ